jgi:hypothetical protein
MLMWPSSWSRKNNKKAGQLTGFLLLFDARQQRVFFMPQRIQPLRYPPLSVEEDSGKLNESVIAFL